MSTTTYTQVAAATGAWTCPVLLPPTTVEQVRARLTDLARSGWPVAAFLYGDAGDPVTELLLYRDPSRRHGTPAIPECIAATGALAEMTGWTPVPEHAPGAGILVGLGLREGYSPDAPQHQPSEAEHLLAEHGADWTARTAWLISARLVDGDVRWYDELGVVIQAHNRFLPAIDDVARRFAQHRFVVTDFDETRTYALAV